MAIHAHRTAAVGVAQVPGKQGQAIADDDRRFARRQARSLPAYILSDRLSAAVPCIVRDISSTGSRLEIVLGRDTAISSVDGLPETFALYIIMDEVEMDCRVAWRRSQQVGVRFSGISRPRPRLRRATKAARR